MASLLSGCSDASTAAQSSPEAIVIETDLGIAELLDMTTTSTTDSHSPSPSTEVTTQVESKPTATHLVGRPGDDYVIPTDEWIKILFVEIDLPVAFRRDRENSDRFIGYIRGRATGYLAVEDFVPDDALVYESWMPACFDNEDGVSGHIISKYEVKGAPNVLHISRRYECARKSADDIQEKLDVTAWRIYGKWLVFRGYDPFATFDLEHQIIKAFRDS